MPKGYVAAETIAQVKDLTGGVNLRPAVTNIKPEQARRLLNTLISSVGELAAYLGFESFSTTSLGSRRAQGGKRIYLADSIFTLAADNGSVYKPTDAGVWGSAVIGSLNATNPVDFVYDRDIVAFFDGEHAPYKSADGTTWSSLGIGPPASAPTLAAVAGGSLADTNVYEVGYAYGDTTLGHIGNISATATQAAATPNLTVRVSVTASADAQVNRIYVYVRNVTAGETVLRLYDNYTNTTTTHDVTSNLWDDQDEAPTDHDVALPMKFGCVWKNRWWGADATVGNRLRFSQIFQNQSWPDTFYVDIPFERGEDITCIIPLGDVLIIFGFTKFYLIIGQTSLDFEVRPALGGQTGAFGFRCADVVENGVIHGGAPGVYLFNGASDELLSYPIDPAWRDYVSGTAASILALTPITYHKFSKEVRVGVTRLYPTGTTGEWIMDLNRSNIGEGGPVWFSTDRNIGGYIQWDGNEANAGSQGRIFSWSTTVAKLFEERVGTSRDGSDLSVEYDGYTLPFSLQMARLFNTYIEYQPCEGNLTVDLKVDEVLMGSQTFSLGVSNDARYGIAVYGTDTYAGSAGRLIKNVWWPLASEGRTAQLLFRYTGQGDFKLFSYGHNINVEPVPRGL